MTDDYTIGNEGARKLTEENAAVDQPQILANKNQEPIHDETGMFHEMLDMFEDIAINDEIIEKRWISVVPSEKEDSESFTFDKAGSGSGVIKLDDTYMTADISVEIDGNILNKNTIIDYVPSPLQKWWCIVDVHDNEVAMTNSHTDNLFVTDVLSRSYNHPEKAKDIAGCNMGWRNTPGQENYLGGLRHANRATTISNNKPAFKRVDSIVNVNSRFCVDDVNFAYYMAGPQFVPVNNRLTVKFTKDSSGRIFTGHEHERTGNADGTDSDFHIANAHDAATPHANHTAHVINGGQSADNLANLDKIKTKFKNFTMYYKVLTPKAQIQSQINQKLDVESKYINAFYQEVHSLGNSKFTCNNVFGSNMPYVMIICFSRSEYINGDFYHTPTYCTWEKMKEIIVKVNNNVVGYKIKNSKDAYFHTRRALHLGDSESMYVPYEYYEDGNAFVVF